MTQPNVAEVNSNGEAARSAAPRRNPRSSSPTQPERDGDCKRLAALPAAMNQVVASRFPTHPFAQGVTPANFKPVLSHYLAMSTGFPFIQAGAIGRAFWEWAADGGDFGAVESTSVVGAFLVWDEFGGHAKILREGMPGLPSVLQTDAFHANLLRADIELLAGERLEPSFEEPTQAYLKRLSEGLGNRDPVVRAAHMAAFEHHANAMIGALWSSVSSVTAVAKEDLGYFETHVGGDDPAEAYHVAMTTEMLSRVVAEGDVDRFLVAFEQGYRLSFEWCAALVSLRSNEAA